MLLTIKWYDWKWQVRNRITRHRNPKEVINITEEEEKDIEKVLKKFRMGITPVIMLH